jgi:hypothetical protein
VPGKARRVSVDIVTAGYPRVFGLGTEAGAWFTGDDERGGAAVVVISDRLWREWFGGDPAIVGRRTLRVEQVRLTIVGVASRGFRGPYPGFAANTDAWVPMGAWPAVVLAGIPAERRAEQAARLVEANWLESFRVAPSRIQSRAAWCRSSRGTSISSPSPSRTARPAPCGASSATAPT